MHHLFYALSTLLVPFMNVVAPVAAFLVILLGLHTAGLLRLPFLNYEFRLLKSAPAQGGLLGGFLLGVGFAAGWTPCIGTTLGAVSAPG